MYGARAGKVVLGLANACQQSGDEGAAGKAVVAMPGCIHAVDVDDGGRSIVGVSRGQGKIGAIAINRDLAGVHIDGIG